MTQKPALYKNILANFFGSAWNGFVALIFLPYYIHLMGGEAFAIISVFISLINILSVLDLGISPTLNRELAICSVHNSIEKMRNILRSLECTYFPIVLMTSLILLSSSSLIANQWLNSNKLQPFVIEQSLMIMSVVVALHLLTNFYSAGLSGLQFQVFLNVVNVIMNTLRYAGVVPIMLCFSTSPVVFFLWQLIINLLHLLIVRQILWKKIHSSLHKPLFIADIIKNIWRFSFAVSVINLLGMITINMDKILLSKLLTLEEFGYYSVASVIAMSIAPRLASPFFAAVYPRLTQYVKEGNTELIVFLYHRACQALSTTIIPATVFISLYSNSILLLWTGSQTVSDYADIILIYLSIGCLFNGIKYIPYALQLSYGWTKLSMFANITSLMIITPLIFYFYPKYGATGAAFSWFFVNSSVTLVSVSIMHKYLLNNKEGIRWFVYDNGIVLLIVLIIGVLLKSFFLGHALWELCIVLLCLYLAPILCISSQRKSFNNLLRVICYAGK